MSQSENNLRGILGKRIQAVVHARSFGSNPPDQLFLVFDDGTYYEFYGNQIQGTSSPSQGDQAAAVRSLVDRECVVKQVSL